MWSFIIYDFNPNEEKIHSKWGTRKQAALVALEYVSKLMNKRRRMRLAKCRKLIESGDRGIDWALLLLREATIKDFKIAVYVECD